MEANHEASIAPDGSLGYKDNQNMEPDDQASVSIDMIDDAEKDFKKFRETNPEVTKTNLRIIKNILNRLHTATSKINNMKPLDKEAYYYVINSGTIVIYEICRMLRLANYYKLAARYLQFNIMSLDHNIILTTGKYLHWRVKNYIECSRAFADSKDFPKAIETIQKGIVQVDRLKKIEEQDPPVLDADKQAIESGFRLLREMEIKYQLQSGTLTPDQWKKKIEDTFKDHYHRALCVVESLTTDQSDNCIPIQQKTDKTPWKKEALNQGISLLHPNIEKVKEALIQIHEHKKKEKEKQGLTFNSENPDAEVEEMLATHKQMHDEMIKEKEWKQASYGAPLEIHIQMIIFAYETGNRDQFESLLKSALIRLKFRRYEVPYVSTVDILMSTSKDANIPNSFMKLPKDLNAANLRNELAKLKKAHKKKGGEEEVKKEPIKATKDKGKEKGKEKAPEPVAEVEEEQEVIATPEELEQIKHIYVNLLIQRSKNPKNAIVGLNVAMIDETSEYEIPENHYAVAVPIRQHDGIYEKNQTIPYIMFKRTPNFLRDEEDLLSLITDVTVISGKSPNILPPLGYHKIPLDLRQTPHDLERAPDVDYVSICYKTDKDINTYERDLLTLKKLSDLSQSLVSHSDPKSQEIPYGAKNVGMLYDFELLMDITKNVKDSLLGPVGTFYARERHDQLDCLSRILLTKFIFPVRKKMEQYFELKSQGELVAADRINFKEVLLRIHAILAKNTLKKPELALVYLIASIYLSNLCEEDGDYRNSIQIMRSALSRVVEARESRLKSNLEYSTNPVAAMSVHVHGHKIHEIQKAKQERYKTWENLILRRERERIRQDKGLPPLDEDEADEEASEIERLESEKHDFQDYILKQKKADEPADGEQDANKPNWREKDYYEYFSTLDDLLNDLHIDVLA